MKIKAGCLDLSKVGVIILFSVSSTYTMQTKESNFNKLFAFENLSDFKDMILINLCNLQINNDIEI